jgi:hypothetical protein
MGLGTLGQVAKRLRVPRSHIRAAVDSGLLRPARTRSAGDHGYVRLFDLEEADAQRHDIVAGVNSGELVPRKPRTRSRQRAGAASTASAVVEQGSSQGYIDCTPLGCSPAPDDLMARLNEEAERKERERGRDALGISLDDLG